MQTLEASREILWNLSDPINQVVMYLTFLLSLVIGGIGVLRHIELWRSGQPDPSRSIALPARLIELFTWSGLQRGVIREPFAGAMHTLIYIGFVVLLFTTTMVAIDHDLGIKIYRGDFYLILTVLSDVLGFGLLIGLGLAAYRRYVSKPNLIHNRSADSLILSALALLVVQGFVLEGLRIHVTQDPWRLYSPIGYAVAVFFWSLNHESARLLHFAVWWFHTLTVFLCIALAPYTKFFHIVASSINLYFRPSKRAKGELAWCGDIEQIIEKGEDVKFGLENIKDYTWKQLLDLDACTSCGRCQEVCPAYASGTPLSPKWLILDTRNHALSLHANGDLLSSSLLPDSINKFDGALTKGLYLASSGLNGSSYVNEGSFRANNPKVQRAAKAIGISADARMAGDVLDPDVFWSCTTCYACVEACPVGINHVDQIMGNRRNMVLMQGEVPHEAQRTLKGLEGRGNPYGPQEERMNWATGLDLKIIQPGDCVDYLYWVGCVSAYDTRKQKIARSLVTIMQRAGLNFGVLGNAESCTGDPARRLGDENVFQTLAKSNIETLKSVRFKYLVANCPHCFNTIKNEYPAFGNLGDGQEPEIIHHSTLLKRLTSSGALKLKSGVDQNITFHDPCYLGRYNDEYDAPRDVLTQIGGVKLTEMANTKQKSMCCGAGGGHFWMDLKTGSERVNVLRIEQAADTAAGTVATGCPFCMQMLEDGAKITNRDLPIKDIAELLLENLS